ncbi:TonB dependent receptor, putative [Rhodospirillum centenum SW]|uniref:TonB dependent receptor, putative n=1 Tax=Rhodospirillum centenum (strain ATCC 51521 / SW) TaxID=414684 RepID=B6IQL9_RHOCS|nr:TonB dependent receptor, putative [Rhodospirillum centenum SW]
MEKRRETCAPGSVACPSTAAPAVPRRHPAVRAGLAGLVAPVALIQTAGMATALAQTAPEPRAAVEGPQRRAAVEEIVVTAQRRQQSAQDVPISLQVVDSARIERVAAQDMGDLAAFVPGLQVKADSPTQPKYTIRGVVTDDFGVGTDPAVGIYVDGFYSARSGASLLAFNDVERIEVLKGPQGTLFGRNSAAGAVSIITRKPSDEAEGRFLFRVGSYDKRRAEAMMNLPAGDDLALRVNAVFNQRDGWLKDDATGEGLSREDNWATRAALRWGPTAGTNAILTWEHEELDQDARPAISVIDVPPFPGRPSLPYNPATFIDPRDGPVLNDVIDNHETRELDSVTLTLTHPLSWGELASLTAFRHFETENREDEDGTNRRDLYFDTNNIEDNTSFYQEFKLSGAAGPVDWVAGASFWHEKAEQQASTSATTDSINAVLGNIGVGTPFSDLDNFVLIPFGIPFRLLGNSWNETMANEGTFKAYAVYGDAIWHVTDRLNLTLGGRLTYDKKTFSWFNGPRLAPELDETIRTLADLGVLDLAGVPPEALRFDVVFDVGALEGRKVELSDSWTDFSPRVVLDYALTDSVMAYASYTQGYKAGGFNSVEPLSRFDNEKVRNYEIGVKTSFPETGLQVNVAGYKYFYDDKQRVRLVQETSGSSVPQYIVETSDDKAVGIDLDALWRPIDPLEINLAVSWIDAEIDSKVTREGLDLSGQPTGEPRWTLSGGAAWTQPLGDGATVQVAVQHAYRGAPRCNTESLAVGTCGDILPFDVGGPYHRTDLRVAWTSASGAYTVAAFANNVFDNRYVTSLNRLTADTLGTVFSALSEPRMLGVDFAVRF